MLPAFLALAAGYLLGSVPFAVLIARRHGVDILKVGSGNPGATNVRRTVGKGPGNLCFALDAAKGLVAAGWPLLAFSGGPGEAAALAGLVGALLGHSFSVFLRFRGGKGVATTLGGLLALMPLVLLVGVGVWLAVFFTTRYVSLASILLGLSLPLTAWLMGDALPLPFLLLAVFLAVVIILRHLSNLRCLLAGTEYRWEKPKPPA